MAVRTRSLVLLLTALAAGTGAAWISLGYLRQQAQPLLNQTAAPGRAFVATRDLPAGTVVGQGDVREVEWPGDAVPPGLLGAAEEVVGRGVLTGMRFNEPFLDSKLAPRGAGGGLPVLITEGRRALSIRVDDVVGVAGFVVPGTRVDILLTMNSQSNGEVQTKAILQNIQALAAGQSVQVDMEGKPQQVSVVTLLVTPEQAEALTLASSQGRIQMALRNQLDTLAVQTLGARVSGLFGTVRAAPAQAIGPRRSAPPPQPAAIQETIVEGFRGGERSLTRFTRPATPPPAPPEER
jgi:pilus assembly protein CpaB